METKSRAQGAVKYQVLGWLFLLLIFLCVVSVVYYLEAKEKSGVYLPQMYSARTINDSTINKYTSKDYGFRLFYPKDFVVKEISPSNLTVVKNGTFDANEEIGISVSENQNNLTAAKWVSKYKQKSVGSKIENVDLDGVQGVKFTEKGTPVYVSYYFSHANLIYRFYVTKDTALGDVLDEIFTSFKFTK
jgi:hypothetical protein